MRTKNKIDRKDLGELNIIIDWDDNRHLYINPRDLDHMTQDTTFQIIQRTVPAIEDEDGTVYITSDQVLQMLKQIKTPLYAKTYRWLKEDILPSIQVMPYGTSLKL